jgi:hypothetical protein
MKYLGVNAKQTEDIYGFGVYLFPLSLKNRNVLHRLKMVFKEVKAIDANISRLTYHFSELEFSVTNDEFGVQDEDNPEIVDMNDVDFKKFTTESTSSFKLKGSVIKVGEFGIQVTSFSKWTSDEVWGEISFENFEKFYEESLVDSK